MDLNQEKIIELLEQNNQLLNKIYQLESNQIKEEHRKQLISFIFHSIPWIALVLISWFIFSSIFHYLEVLQNNVNTLKDSIVHFFDSFKNLIPDFSSAGEKLNSLWENTKEIF